jgi:iron complex transport system ATP-binding protein
MSVVASGLALPGRLKPTELMLRAGELTCLVGPNGSGKTSLLHALAGIGRPSGTVRIDGADPHVAPPTMRRRLLSYLPASRDIAWPLLAGDLLRLDTIAGDAELGPVLDALDLSDLLARRVDQLSTGERSRVLIGRALAGGSSLLLLDEPVSNLDPLWQLRLLDFVRAQARGCEQTVLLAIHDLDLAADYADRIIVMQGGMVVADSEPASLFAGPVIPDVFGVRRTGGTWRPA